MATPTPTPATPPPVDCVIIGAGITSLSIATELLDRGYTLGIVAKDLPEDGHSVGFASPWAVRAVYTSFFLC